LGAGRGFAALVGCRGAVVVLLTSAVAALVGCRGAVVVLLTPAVAALVGCPALATDMPSWPGPNASRHLADPK
jgi:hypothetical protein